MFDALVGGPTGVDLNGGVDGMRVGCLPDDERRGIEQTQLAAYDRSLELLAELGAEIMQFKPPKPFEEMKVSTFVIVTAEGYFHHQKIMDDPEALVDEHVRARFAPGVSISSSDYVGALLERENDRQKFFESMAHLDALVTPTTPMLPVPLSEVDEESLSLIHI